LRAAFISAVTFSRPTRGDERDYLEVADTIPTW
jgi:hypothetical protein